MSAQIERKKVMIIEDNELNQKIAKMIIKELGHTPFQVYDGLKAVDAVKKDKPDLIILDIQLVGITGIEISREIKDDPELAHIPIIVVTALATEEDKRKILEESKCDNYIAKPFLPNIFAEMVGRYIPIRSIDWSSANL